MVDYSQNLHKWGKSPTTLSTKTPTTVTVRDSAVDWDHAIPRTWLIFVGHKLMPRCLWMNLQTGYNSSYIDQNSTGAASHTLRSLGSGLRFLVRESKLCSFSCCMVVFCSFLFTFVCVQACVKNPVYTWMHLFCYFEFQELAIEMKK